MLQLFYNDIYHSAISADARFPRERYRLVYEELQQRACAEKILIQSPTAATREQLLRVHTPVDAFLQNRLSDRQIRQIGFRPWRPEFIERTLLITGGSIAALHAAIDSHGFAGNLAGGTHHAYADHGEGYCVFNDLAICVALARQHYPIKRIAIIDCDVHQGNGTAAIFANDPDVLTYSIHGEKNYPFRKEQSDIDIALPDETDDETYLTRLQTSLHQALQGFDADLYFYQAGCDPLREDRLGKLALTRAGLKRRNAFVMELACERRRPMVLFMGGGYAEPIALSAVCHADVFEQASNYHARLSPGEEIA